MMPLTMEPGHGVISAGSPEQAQLHIPSSIDLMVVVPKTASSVRRFGEDASSMTAKTANSSMSTVKELVVRLILHKILNSIPRTHKVWAPSEMRGEALVDDEASHVLDGRPRSQRTAGNVHHHRALKVSADVEAPFFSQ